MLHAVGLAGGRRAESSAKTGQWSGLASSNQNQNQSVFPCDGNSGSVYSPVVSAPSVGLFCRWCPQHSVQVSTTKCKVFRQPSRHRMCRILTECAQQKLAVGWGGPDHPACKVRMRGDAAWVVSGKGSWGKWRRCRPRLASSCRPTWSVYKAGKA